MERKIELPIDEAAARELRMGDILYVTGTIFTARDEAHLRMLEEHDAGRPLPFDPSRMALFHCGPVMAEADCRRRRPDDEHPDGAVRGPVPRGVPDEDHHR